MGLSHFFKKTFFLIFSFVVLPLFFSCAVDDAEISTASASLILEYSDEENPPETRLAVFVQTKNAVQRTDSFSAENLDSGYVWTVSSPEMFESNGKQYAYSTRLKAPDGEKIPKGSYKIVYYDAAGNSSEFVVQLSYDDSLLEKKSSEIQNSINGRIENLAVYDEMNELVFFGKRKNSWTSNRAIQNEYKIAASSRVCFSSPSNSVICFMPEEYFEK